MKNASRLFASVTVAIAILLATGPAGSAADLYWDANAAAAGRTDGAGAWLGADQWWTGTANTTWTSGDSAIFGYSGAGGAVTLASPTTVGSILFNPFTGTYTLGTAGQTIMLNGGITNSGAGGFAFASSITLGAAQTWTVNTASAAKGGINLNGNALTIAGSANVDLGDSTANFNHRLGWHHHERHRAAHYEWGRHDASA
jgi:hypothetical protein